MKHANNDELLGLLYGLDAEREHVSQCSVCQEQLAEMTAARKAVHSASAFSDDIPTALLHEQRRLIIAKLEKAERRSWFSNLPVQRWASAAVVVAALASGVAMYETKQSAPIVVSKAGSEIPDMQLVDDVSQVAGDPEPSATGPLQALFADQ